LIDNAFKLQRPVIPVDSRQMLLTLAEDWDSLRAQVYLCEKNSGVWQVSGSFQAVCGRNGMAWGLGLYPASPGGCPEPGKKEGDGKTPAGIFQLGACFGYAPRLTVNRRWSYRRLISTMRGIDDPASRYYNQIVDVDRLPGTAGADWNSSETMRRADNLYKWLVVIGHNPDNIPGAGSLIFLHLWQDQNSGTAGCTATSERTILKILAWLEPTRRPILVQLPREVYYESRAEWGLPVVCQ
jgi:L,D-peptidoglycan transpeptidase YkuD (ErfK/YbiS/YcfS/YnhG family)